MSSGKVFQWVIAFTENDDNPKAEWHKGTTQSLVDDNLVDFTESVERLGFLSRIFKVYLYRDFKGLITDSPAWPQHVWQYDKWAKIVAYINVLDTSVGRPCLICIL